MPSGSQSPNPPQITQQSTKLEQKATIIDISQDIKSDSQVQYQNFHEKFSVAPQKESFIGSCMLVSISMLIMCVVGFFFKPVYGILGIFAVIPGCILFTVIILVNRKMISINLAFEMMFSGIIAFVLIFIIEFALGTIVSLLEYGIGLSPTKVIEFGKVAIIQGNLWVMVLNAFISSFLIAASVEETAKYLLLWRVSERRGFMNPTACVVYAVSAALGIATIENLEYVLKAASRVNPNDGFGAQFFSGFMVASVRSILAIPLHATTAALIGLSFAEHHFLNSKRNIFTILALPIVIHGGYDFVLLFTSALGTWQTVGIVFAIMLVFIGIARMIIQMIQVDKNWKTLHCQIYDAPPKECNDSLI